MASEFKYGQVSRKLKVASVKPSVLAKLWKLDETSLVLTDEEGDIHMYEAGVFDPPLNENRTYEVDGTELAAQTMALVQRDKDLSVIRGDERKGLVKEVIENTAKLDASSGMLFHAPMAVVMVKALTILAGTAPDPSLITSNNTANTFKRLKTPTSFKACLYQVATSMCRAFRTADFSMNTIKALLVDLPFHFCSTLEIAGEGDSAKTKKLLIRTADKIENASKRCSVEASEAKKAFQEVILDVTELCQAAIAAKGMNDSNVAELKKLKAECEKKKKTLEVSEKSLQADYEERKARAKDALAEYKEQINNSGNLGKMFLATLTDGVMAAVKTATSLPSAFLQKAAESVPVEIGMEKCSNEMRYAMEHNLMQMLETVAEGLLSPNELDKDKVDDYILSLKSVGKYSPFTEEGKELSKRAKKTHGFLEKNGGKLKEAAMKKEIDELRISLKSVVSAARSVREDRQRKKDVETQVKYSFMEKLVQAETEQIQASKTLYTEESRKEEELRKELKKNREELGELISKLQSIDLQEVNFNEIIGCLREGIEYLGKVEENWGKLTDFFDQMLIVVDVHLKGNIETFVEEAKDPLSRQMMLKSALSATGYCIQVGNCAEVYTQVSSKYVMPIISSIGKDSALTRDQAQAEKANLSALMNDSHQGVKNLIAEEREKFQKRVEDQMAQHADKFDQAIMAAPIIPAIKN